MCGDLWRAVLTVSGVDDVMGQSKKLILLGS